MHFDKDVIRLNIDEIYEVFEHREIVWAQLDGYEWHPSQILFKWKNGKRRSPHASKHNFGAVQVLVAFFEVHQTAKTKLSQRHCFPFYYEPNLDISSRMKNGKHKNLIKDISNAMILATLQQEIINKLHSEYHDHIHKQNALYLQNLNIPSQNWLNQKILIYNDKDKIWRGARIMYYSYKLDKHFIVYDDYGFIEWENINNYDYVDWCDDNERDELSLSNLEKKDNKFTGALQGINPQTDDDYLFENDETGNNIHKLKTSTIHSIKEIHGYGIDECTTNKISLSTMLIGDNVRNCNKCWICMELCRVNISPSRTKNKKVDPMNSVHCICCKKRAHIACLKKPFGIDRDKLKNHLLQIHCDQCKNCALCKRELKPQTMIQWTKQAFHEDSFMEKRYQSKTDFIECDLCRRNFHKKCLPNDDNDNLNKENGGWLCVDCRECKCCNVTRSEKWFDGGTLCNKCNDIKNMGKLCQICCKHNYNAIHEPFWIQCMECDKFVHIQCSPFTLNELVKTKNKKTFYVCTKCNDKTIKKLMLNTLEILIEKDLTGIVVNHINSILLLRTSIIQERISLVRFVNMLHKIWEIYDATVVDKMIDYTCQIIARFFNHLFAARLQVLAYKKNKMKVINVIHDKQRYLKQEEKDNYNYQCMYKCKYITSNEFKINCYSCGSPQDEDNMIICNNCCISFHPYCVKSTNNYHNNNQNDTFCPNCLWQQYCQKGKAQNVENDVDDDDDDDDDDNQNLWVLMGSCLKQLYQLLDLYRTNPNIYDYDEFIMNNEIPLWIKPLLFDPVNDITPKLKKRTTTTRVGNDPTQPVGLAPSLRQSLTNINKNDTRKCELCNYHINDMEKAAKVCGRLLPIKSSYNKKECKWVHAKCALASTNINVKRITDMIEIDITETLNISKQYKCHICHQIGASIHCSISDCTLSYHYPCMVVSEIYDSWNYHQRPFFCNMHSMHYNNNDHILHGVKLIDINNNKYNKILNDNTMIIVTDNSQIGIIGKNNIAISEIDGNRIEESTKKGDVVIMKTLKFQFWSYKNENDRGQFEIEANRKRNGQGWKFKMSVYDDPDQLNETFDDIQELIEKMYEKYQDKFERKLIEQTFAINIV